MGKNPYLMVVEENTGESTYITLHLIEAEDEQMVKYHYHRTLKDGGYRDTSFGKHILEMWGRGTIAELETINPLMDSEYLVLSRYLPNWVKV